MIRSVSPQTRRVFILSLPIFAELLLQLLVGNIDQLMISKLGSAAVAAVGNGNQIMAVVIFVLETTSAATTILLTQNLGAQSSEDSCNEIATVGLSTATLFSILIGLILLFFPHLLFDLLRTPAEAFDGSCLYLKIVGGTVLIQGLYIQLCAILRSYTLLREVVVISVIMNLLNVIGNLLLINGWWGFPKLGIVGAAAATVLSKLAGLLLAVWVLYKKCPVRFSLRYLFPFPKETVRRLLGIALPLGTESLSYNVSQIFILRFINLMGTTVIATKVYASMLANVSYIYTVAIAQATQIIVGYLMGAGKVEEAGRRVWSTTRIALVVSEFITLLLLLFCDPIYNLFTTDPAIHALGRQILLVELALELGRTINIIMVKTLTTAGDVWFPVAIGIFSMWTIAVFGGWLLGHRLAWGLVGIWVAMAFDECLRGILFTVRFRRGGWKKKRLVSERK
jgi:putative MATE family efflux protein